MNVSASVWPQYGPNPAWTLRGIAVNPMIGGGAGIGTRIGAMSDLDLCFTPATELGRANPCGRAFLGGRRA